MKLLSLAALALLLTTVADAQLSRSGRARMDNQDLGGNSNMASLSAPDTSFPAFISGGVVMADGSATPKETLVHMFCGGFPRASDYVSPKGEFDLDLEGGRQGVTDATRASAAATGLPERSNLGIVNLNGCVVRAELTGYDSTEIALGMNSTLDDPNIGEIVLTRQQGITGDTVSASSLQAPKKAAKNYEKALEEVAQPDAKLDKAAGWLEDAVKEYPEYAAAWTLLGKVRKSLGDSGGALEALERSVAVDARFIPPYPDLVQLVAASGDMERTIELGETALRLNRNLDQVRFFVAAAQLRAGKQHETVDTSQELIDRGADKQFPQAHQLKGAALANLGDYAGAMASFEKFLELSPNATAAPRIRQQIEEWKSLGVGK